MPSDSIYPILEQTIKRFAMEDNSKESFDIGSGMAPTDRVYLSSEMLDKPRREFSMVDMGHLSNEYETTLPIQTDSFSDYDLADDALLASSTLGVISTEDVRLDAITAQPSLSNNIQTETANGIGENLGLIQSDGYFISTEEHSHVFAGNDPMGVTGTSIPSTEITLDEIDSARGILELNDSVNSLKTAYLIDYAGSADALNRTLRIGDVSLNETTLDGNLASPYGKYGIVDGALEGAGIQTFDQLAKTSTALQVDPHNIGADQYLTTGIAQGTRIYADSINPGISDYTEANLPVEYNGTTGSVRMKDLRLNLQSNLDYANLDGLLSTSGEFITGSPTRQVITTAATTSGLESGFGYGDFELTNEIKEYIYQTVEDLVADFTTPLRRRFNTRLQKLENVDDTQRRKIQNVRKQIHDIQRGIERSQTEGLAAEASLATLGLIFPQMEPVLTVLYQAVKAFDSSND